MDLATLCTAARTATSGQIVIWHDDPAVLDSALVAEVEACLPKGLVLDEDEDGSLCAARAVRS